MNTIIPHNPIFYGARGGEVWQYLRNVIESGELRQGGSRAGGSPGLDPAAIYRQLMSEIEPLSVLPERAPDVIPAITPRELATLEPYLRELREETARQLALAKQAKVIEQARLEHEREERRKARARRIYATANNRKCQCEDCQNRDQLLAPDLRPQCARCGERMEGDEAQGRRDGWRREGAAEFCPPCAAMRHWQRLGL